MKLLVIPVDLQREVIYTRSTNDPLQGRGGAGTVSWPGAFGGWWQADPNDGSVLLFLAHNMLERHQMARGIGLEVWATIAAFHALATAS